MLLSEKQAEEKKIEDTLSALSKFISEVKTIQNDPEEEIEGEHFEFSDKMSENEAEIDTE